MLVPLSREASCFYGKGTQWCTAATTGKNYFDGYAILIYVINKTGSGSIAILYNGGDDIECYDENDDIIETEDMEELTGFSRMMIRKWAGEVMGRINGLRLERLGKEIDKAIEGGDAYDAYRGLRKIFKYRNMSKEYAGRIQKLRNIISKDGRLSVLYAIEICGERFKEGEDAIAREADDIDILRYYNKFFDRNWNDETPSGIAKIKEEIRRGGIEIYLN